MGAKIDFDAVASTELGWLLASIDLSVTFGEDPPFRTSAILPPLSLDSEILEAPSDILKLANNLESAFLPTFRSLDFEETVKFDLDPFDSNVSAFEGKTEETGLSGKFAAVAAFPFFSFSAILPKFAGLELIVVSMKLAVVNFPRIFFATVTHDVVVKVFLNSGEFASVVELSELEFNDDFDCALSLL